MARTKSAVSSHASMAKPSLVVLIGILAAGIFLRVWPSAGFHQVGYDEGIYNRYVQILLKHGVSSYPDLAQGYLKWQDERPDAIVPATRIGFILPAAVLAELTGVDSLTALRGLSMIASILLLLAVPLMALRMDSSPETNGRVLLLSALIAVAPLQIHLAQRALIDGYFAFWAILCAWSLWENLQARPLSGWLLTYGISLFVLVLTKENAAFVFLALIAVAVLFAVTRLGRLSWQLLLVTLIAPTLAVLFLSILVGGIGEWLSFYRSFVAKSATLPYPAKFQDGAWYRYIVDFTLLSPVIVALFFGAIFQVKKEANPDVFWAVFLGVSFIGMSSVPFGMSLRFAAYWDVPLRWLATSQLLQLSMRFPRLKRPLALFASVLVLCAVDLFQYWRYFMHGEIYDPVSFQLLHAAKLIK
jgi:4-amino-4-deoxy-L-arabinose transferase-like glycosyltransferase